MIKKIGFFLLATIIGKGALSQENIFPDNGNAGIGVRKPNAPLQFANIKASHGLSTNRKIVLWETTNNNHEFTGFGINNRALRYQTDNASSDHVFYAAINANSSKELMRIKGNGNVGIGISNPNAPLSFPAVLGKKITLYPGNTGDVGLGVSGNRLQIYSDNPNADVAIGFDVAGTFNERFAFKPNGALAVNLNTGLPGQVLTSNGPGAPAEWKSPTNSVFSNSISKELLNNGRVGFSWDPVIKAGETKTINGLTTSFFLSGTSAKVLVSYQLDLNGPVTPCAFCPNNVSGIVDMKLNGAIVSQSFFNFIDGKFNTLSGNRLLTIGPGGPHVITLDITSSAGSGEFGIVNQTPAVSYISVLILKE
jgi:hypothetical protein